MRTTTALCADCQSRDGAHEIRRRRLCSDCFIRYVQSKVFKRMESFRFKNLTGDARKRLLLPLSGGISSLALLNALDTQLARQREKQNRMAYELVLVHVEVESGGDGGGESLLPPASEAGEKKKGLSGLLSSLSLLLSSSHTLLPDVRIHEALQIDSRLEQDLAKLGLVRAVGQGDHELYVSIMAAASTATARSDLEQVFLKRLVVCLAKQHNCESILWGHSDSKLAALALADVAKGRGGSVPMTLSDGPSPAGVRFNYPMRDLFKTELELYASVLPEPLVAMPERDNGPTPGVRNTSIDSLLSTYITSQGEKYPSIMANVVRTASKLQVAEIDGKTSLCAFCFSEVDSRTYDIRQAPDLCYGCQRMQQDIKIAK